MNSTWLLGYWVAMVLLTLLFHMRQPIKKKVPKPVHLELASDNLKVAFATLSVPTQVRSPHPRELNYPLPVWKTLTFLFWPLLH